MRNGKKPWNNCDQSFCTNQGLSQHQRTCKTRNNTRTDSKHAPDVLNVQASSRNSETTEDNLAIPCAKYVWGRYKDYDFEKHLLAVYEKCYSYHAVSQKNSVIH